jgi:hypothetical protein
VLPLEDLPLIRVRVEVSLHSGSDSFGVALDPASGLTDRNGDALVLFNRLELGRGGILEHLGAFLVVDCW